MLKEEQQWFLSLSKNYWGIHNRTQQFFQLFHQPEGDRKRVLDMLVSVAINDFWVCEEAGESERSFHFILKLFESLMEEQLSPELHKYLFYIYFDFFASNFSSFKEREELIKAFLELTERRREPNFIAIAGNLSALRNGVTPIAEGALLKEEAVELFRSLALQTLHFWEESIESSRGGERFNLNFLKEGVKTLDRAKKWEELEREALTFSDIVEQLRNQVEELNHFFEKIDALIYLMELPGTLYHYDYLMTHLNGVIKEIEPGLEEELLESVTKKLFHFYNKNKRRGTHLILDSILELGKKIIVGNNSHLISLFENLIIEFGFIEPGVVYSTNKWELKVDTNHIRAIRVWMELIECNPERMKKLLSALIINLKSGGVFIYDTDFFQKDITKLLNSNIAPIYKQIKQLCRIFPVYFNEIGAEGLVREISTKVDEITHRNDKLIHFLRKQIHTEGNNSHIYITMEILNFWLDLKKSRLKEILPNHLYQEISVESPFVTGVHTLLKAMVKSSGLSLERLSDKNREELEALIEPLNHPSEIDRERVILLIELHKLLKEKYQFENANILPILKRHHFISSEEIEQLERALEKGNEIDALKSIFSMMVELNQIIFNPKESKGWESVSYRRHIAFGIPSMYGYYREEKFEALGIIFRLESTASGLVHSIISKIKKEYFTAKTLNDIFLVIELLREGLSLDGIYDPGFDSHLKMFQYSLTSGSFSVSQYINIFQFMEGNLKEIIDRYFIRPYQTLLEQILPKQIAEKENLNKPCGKKRVARESEVFYRELLSSAFLVQLFDNFIGEILNTLRRLHSGLSQQEIQSLMTYNTELIASPLYRSTPSMDNQVFIGSKAYYLKSLYLNNYPVPPGFVVTTEVFRRIDLILKVRSLNRDLDILIREHIAQLEGISGLKLGDPKRPLLLSVRSGAAISMPGAMNTFLNVGLNDDIAESLSKQDNYGWTSWDCYRRLLQTWGMSYGLERNEFDKIITDYKERYDVSQKVQFTPSVMREIAFAYKALLEKNGIELEQDPFLQIKKAIISVFRSWDTARAKVYREHLSIAEEWGTAVIVQQMIFGNLHKESGSGVLFTHDKNGVNSGVKISGDFTFVSQGEDIVAGLVNTLPISEEQRIKHYKKSELSLEVAYPALYERLHQVASELVEIHGYNHQEIEFTFETSDPEGLYILQTRDMVKLQQKRVESFDLPERMMERVGCGIGVGNRVLNGVIVFDAEDLARLREEGSEERAILVRPDTVPDDIEMIFECEGLLTARGGATSHAAVTAASLGKVGVVNCDDMVVFEKEKRCLIGEVHFSALDKIAIDGNKGVIYRGHYPVRVREL